MQRKFFPFDKNYLLEQAQLSLKEELLVDLVEMVKQTYQLRYNPLGLMDKNIEKIVHTTQYNLIEIAALYDELAGIYRYQYSSNQLEILFDGRDHLDKYKEDWSIEFKNWIQSFSLHKSFLKAVLETAVFNKENSNNLVYNRLKNFISDYFGVKIYKYKGIIPKKLNKTA